MNTQQDLRLGEFVALMALMTSLIAFAIDAMLPALSEISHDLGVQRDNDRQLVVSVLFLGLALAQIVYGPLSDSIGRKPAIYIGLALFAVGSLLSAFAASFQVMLLGRFLQGIGAAGPRVVTMALVRDRYKGRAMARIMSLVMTVFILVPVFAPALGQGVILVSHWRAIFGILLLLALIALVWFGSRQPETLTLERRIPLSARRIASAVREVCINRVTFGYTIAAGLIFGAFLGFLTSAQQIFQEQYSLGARFPLYFAVLALAVGGASYLNARLVMRYGMQTLVRWALLGLSGLSLVFFVFCYAVAGNPLLWVLMAYLMLSFVGIGILLGNFNALAMEPLGHIAGVAAAVVGSLTTLISLLLGTWIGQSFDGTVLPLVGGFTVLGMASFGVVHWIQHNE